MRKNVGMLAVALLLVARPASAQQPGVVNGTLQARAATAPLDREFAGITAREAGPVWIGYSMPVVVRNREMGCWSDEGRYPASRVGPLHLEGSDSFFVLFRIDARRVDRIRLASPECQLDAGGLTVYWLTGVLSADSLAWLATFVGGDAAHRLGNSAIAAIAMHDGTPATDRLISLARSGENGRVRGDALFWLAQRAGDKAVGAIADAIARDPDTEVKKKAVFALSQLPKDEGVRLLIDVARANANPAVRKQAMFWLGQSHDPRALQFFEEILRK